MPELIILSQNSQLGNLVKTSSLAELNKFLISRIRTLFRRTCLN